MRRKPWARPELAASHFVIDKPEQCRGEWNKAFANPNQPLYVELGCGKGGFIAQKAFDTPDINFLAVDIKSEVLAVGRRTADRIFAEGGRKVDNLRLTAYNIEHIENILCREDNVQKIYINFCNPWPKPRDFKHRLTHPRQLEKYKMFLTPGCEIVFKTDDDMLFRFTKEYFPEAGFEIQEIIEELPETHPASAIITEHELKFRSMGLPIHYIRAVLPQKERKLMKPVILVSAGYNTAENGQNRRYLYQAYGDAITRAGGIPLIPLDDGELADELFELCDGLLLTGGPDLDPSLYGQEMLPECGKLDLQRDSMEYKLLKMFEKGEKPVFGICRGLQIINCYFGGTLWQDLPSQCGVVHSGGHTCVHKTRFAEGSLLNRLYGDEITTNSYHHQAIDKVAEGFDTVAVAEDGTVEAIAHKTMPIWAVQWHPERMTGAERFEHHGPDSAPIFAEFIASCKK